MRVMDEENNKQNEARRVLDAIRQQRKDGQSEEKVPDQPLRWVVSEDAAQLQNLVNQSRGIKNQLESKKEDLPDPESIDPISVEQIKVMRKSVVETKADKTLLLQKLYETLIRAFFESIEFLKPSTRAKRCLIEGHQCLHCGQKFPGALSVVPELSNSQRTTIPPSTTTGKPEK